MTKVIYAQCVIILEMLYLLGLNLELKVPTSIYILAICHLVTQEPV